MGGGIYLPSLPLQVDAYARLIVMWVKRRQSIKKPNFWNSETASARNTLAMLALYSGDFKLYSDASSITSRQLVIELDALEWVCV